ncbi:hypothetical protein, partial [Candidatus Frankia nodulisporulans]
RTPCLREGLVEPDGVRAGLDEVERDPLARAHSAYLREVATTDELVREAVPADGRLRAASVALAAEGDAVAAADAETATADALAELGLAPPARMRRLAQRLLDIAVKIAATPVPAAVSAVA